MIQIINGRILEKHPNSVVLDIGSIGLECLITLGTYDKLPAEGSPCRLLTYLHVREDVLQLYGFAEEDERRKFHKLISLSGIGPKQAIHILSGIRYDQLRQYIVNGDVTAVKRAPGVGDKTARRIILELKDTMSDDEASALSGIPAGSPLSRQVSDAALALESLGYKKAQIQLFIAKNIQAHEKIATEEIIKRFLSMQNRS